MTLKPLKSQKCNLWVPQTNMSDGSSFSHTDFKIQTRVESLIPVLLQTCRFILLFYYRISVSSKSEIIFFFRIFLNLFML